MEAKDTVMKIAELLDIEEAVEDAVFSGQETDTKPVAIAKAQAESSFKAGREEGFILAKVTDPVLSSKAEHEELNRRAKVFLEDVRKAGMREVVEWIEKYKWLQEEILFSEEWQAQLKEWGL